MGIASVCKEKSALGTPTLTLNKTRSAPWDCGPGPERKPAMKQLIEKLEEDEDVTNVYHNIKE